MRLFIILVPPCRCIINFILANNNNMEKKNIVKLKLKKYLVSLLFMAIGAAMMGVGVAQFLLPNKLSSGGFSGIATIFYYLFHFPVGATILLLNIPCFILAFIKVGKEFFFKSLMGTSFLSFFIDFFEKFEALTTDKVLACIFGGILVGIGTAIVLKGNGSTGGSDLVSILIKSYQPGLSTSNIIVIFDAIVITLNVIVFKELEIGLYSAIAIYIMGKMIDIVFEGIDFTKMIFIISNQSESIAKEISQTIERGSTGIYSKGMYTQQEKTMLMCVASRGEVIKIRQVANKIDPKAFIVISNAREVFGQGFKKG